MFGRNTEAKSATNGIHVQTVTNTPRTLLDFYSGLSLQENVHLCVVYGPNRLLMEDLNPQTKQETQNQQQAERKLKTFKSNLNS